MSAHERRTRGDDTVLALHLARGATWAEAAAASGMSEATARRRPADPAFGELVDRLRADVVSRASARLDALLDFALDTVEELAGHGVPNDAVRLRAALALLDRQASYREALVTEDRLRALEERAGIATSPSPLRSA